MPDPFQDLSRASPGMLDLVVAALERRAADPQMTPIIDSYIERIAAHEGRIVEIGAGTGAVARRIAARFPGASVIGVEPSAELVTAGGRLAGDASNLTLVVGDGAALDEVEDSADVALLHTVVSHVVEPAPLFAEAFRILKPGGQLIACDADFSKMTMGISAGDPLDALCKFFANEFVTDPFVVGKLGSLALAAGFEVTTFEVQNRLDLAGGSCLSAVEMSARLLVDRGIIGTPLAEALTAEFHRRAEAGSLYGFTPFAILIATKP